ncbi:MAG: protein translocase subunit SecF [Cyanobacteria bacterium M_surface_10_m2_119]|nr:protein translocase subunit SecF [Cyanobacteria bacterium M_surface_10_m2_119]
MPSLSSLLQLRVNRHSRLLWSLSAVALVLSVVGLAASWLSPAIGAPLRPGLDFTGGTQIELSRTCAGSCAPLTVAQLESAAREVSLAAEAGASAPDLRGVSAQVLEEGAQVVLRLPTLSAAQGQALVTALQPVVGDTTPGGLSIETIGPTLGSQLLRSSLISLLVSFVGIALYITFRYDRVYAVLALLCLAHDVLITTGVFAWLGLLAGVEVNSLFAVALLTIAGYSVNDTVVIFDRIREKRNQLQGFSLADQADAAVQATLTRSLYTSLTTLLPLIALILFGGSTLFWFAVALSIGILVGAWSSISVAPTLLPLFSRR